MNYTGSSSSALGPVYSYNILSHAIIYMHIMYEGHFCLWHV